MVYGQVINKNRYVIMVFETERTLSIQVAQNVQDDDVMVNRVDIASNQILCEALRIDQPTVIVYKKGDMIYRIDDANDLNIHQIGSVIKQS